MLQRLRKSLYVRFLWSCMAVYLINISIDAPDGHPDGQPEDLSINEQESLVELIVEKILGFEDAFPEYDDQERDDNTLSKKPMLDIYIMPQVNSRLASSGAGTGDALWSLYDDSRLHSYKEIFSPPPEA